MKPKTIFLLSLVIFIPLAACNKKSDFIDALKADAVTCSDSLRVIKVVESKMYREPSSGKDEYVSLFNYLLDHKNEEFDEGIGLYMYEMLKTYPKKFEEVEYYLKQLPEPDQEKILRQIASYVCYDFTYENWGKNREKLIELFHSQFPFLAKRKICLDVLFYYLDNPIM